MPGLYPFIHTGLVVLLLTACAGQGTAPSQAGETPAVQAPAPAQLPARVPAPEAAPPIQAGHSEAQPGGFTVPGGQLRPDIQAYATEVARTRNIPQPEVERLLAQARYDSEVVRLMAPPPRPVQRSWPAYRKRFVEPVRIRAGLDFWEHHAGVLARTEAQTGVPAAIIVAIIGVETIYGRYMGSFRVLDALATLGFRHPDASRPERSQLFRDQLADLAQLHHEGWLDAYSVTGSFAGAMGLAQFMPGSLLRYAADGDGDGRITLESSAADAVASIARFLRLHGWQPGLPVFAPLVLPANAASLVSGGLVPSLSWPALHAQGARLQADGAPGAWQQHPLGVIDLADKPRQRVEYRAGTPNFFAITHYNRSYFYATAVAELALALEREGPAPR